VQRDLMLSAGIKEPRAAITELQIFARAEESSRAEIGKQIFGPATISEALYFATVFNECARLNGFVEIITHSATVNHGGGLRKTRERVWANPVHYAHVMYAPFAGATPLPLKVSCATQSNRGEYPCLVPQDNVPLIDALAARSADGKTLLLMLLSRSATATIHEIAVELGDLKCAGEAELVTLSGSSRLDANNPEKPQKIVPQRSSITVSNGRITVPLPAFTLLRITVALG
jgi:alpha-L-arabinofuranosidase